jgi:hypothetical protein
MPEFISLAEFILSFLTQRLRFTNRMSFCCEIILL